MRERIRKWVAPIITMVITIFIFYMSSRPAVQSDEISLETTKTAVGLWSLLPFFDWNEESMQQLAMLLNPFMRKVAHFGEFAVLGISAFISVRWVAILKKMWNKAGAAFVYCLVVAVVDETLQLFVDGRHGSIWDVLLDGSGAVTGILFIVLFVRFYKWKK